MQFKIIFTLRYQNTIYESYGHKKNTVVFILIQVCKENVNCYLVSIEHALYAKHDLNIQFSPLHLVGWALSSSQFYREGN